MLLRGPLALLLGCTLTLLRGALRRTPLRARRRLTTSLIAAGLISSLLIATGLIVSGLISSGLITSRLIVTDLIAARLVAAGLIPAVVVTTRFITAIAIATALSAVLNGTAVTALPTALPTTVVVAMTTALITAQATAMVVAIDWRSLVGHRLHAVVLVSFQFVHVLRALLLGGIGNIIPGIFLGIVGFVVRRAICDYALRFFGEI